MGLGVLTALEAGLVMGIPGRETQPCALHAAQELSYLCSLCLDFNSTPAF